MAIWQVDCYIISKNNLKKTDKQELISLKGENYPFYCIDFLEQKKSWSKNIIQFGNDDETCIQFFYEKDELENINCRLDLRSLDIDVLLLIIDYVKKLNAMFLIEDSIINPEISEVVNAIEKSDANKFCLNLIKYLKNLNNG